VKRSHITQGYHLFAQAATRCVGHAELKGLLQTGLELFKEHEKHAEKLVNELK
jgi:predicted outer membrane protein